MTIAASPALGRQLCQVPSPNTEVQFMARVCLITIERDEAQSPVALRVTPDQGAGTSIYYTRRTDLPAHAFANVLEHEVVWAVNGLRKDEHLEIVPKPGVTRIFEAATLTISFPNQLVSSGPVILRKPTEALPAAFEWNYNVFLHSPSGVLPLDPTIVVEENPK